MTGREGEETASKHAESSGVLFEGTMSGGAITTGHNNRVEQHVHGQPGDAAHEQLLAAIAELRGDLARLVASPQITALATELTEAQEEIQRTGQATPGRLAGLRRSLQDAATAAGMFASAAAVGQALGLLGA